ncbi:MAG TPA: PilZ domain-containing protein [Nitrospiraceae bacterium]|nr:PilZ domain-containing protein [Nitrospiraceae bacterium]
MRFPITVTQEYLGKVLELDCDQETVSLLNEKGQRLGTLGWGFLIERILSVDEDTRFAHSRAHPRAPLAIKVRCTTSEGQQFDSLTGGIGGGGLFIESSAPLSPGTEMTLEFSLPDRPADKYTVKAKVAWTRAKPERYLLFPGMGVQFTEIAEEAQQRLVDLVNALNRTRAVA